MKIGGCCFDVDNEEKPKRKRFWRAQSFPMPSFIVLLVDGDLTAAAACSKPQNERVYWEADSLPSPTPSPGPPQRLPAGIVYCHAVGMPGEGKASIISEFFLPLKIIVFRSCSAVGRIIRDYSDAGPIVICCASANAFLPFGNDSFVSKKPMINQGGEASSAHCPARPSARTRPLSPGCLSPLDNGDDLALNTHWP